jgi:hypothetical protein
MIAQWIEQLFAKPVAAELLDLIDYQLEDSFDGLGRSLICRRPDSTDMQQEVASTTGQGSNSSTLRLVEQEHASSGNETARK